MRSRANTAVSLRRYRDRREAGAVLAGYLGRYAGRGDVTVLGLARGGVPVAAEIAGRLCAPLDVLVIRKLGVPWAPEVAYGALGPDGVVVRTGFARRVRPDLDADVVAAERAELARRDAMYHADRPAASIAGRIAVLIDDGLATGATARAAIAVARRRGAARTVLAVPVGAADALHALAETPDEVICPLVPRDFDAVGRFYRDFRQVPDAEVLGLVS